MELSNNKILITGATEGIGKALVLKFLNMDNTIIAVGRNKEKLKELANIDKRIVPFECDISKLTAMESLILFIENVRACPKNAGSCLLWY